MEKMEPQTEEKNNRKRKRVPKKDQPNRRGRIIIRNLPFKTTDDKLRKHFEEFGTITEIKVLKRPDGKLVGCGFIQYDVAQSAAKAIHHRSGKEFLGRPIICDWAVAKNTYVKNLADLEKNIKEEPIEIKEEKDDDVVEIKEESETDNDESESAKKESDKEEDDSDEDKDDSESEKSSEDDDSDDESDDESEKEKINQEPETKRPKVISNDISEGKTVFIKNVPFTATNDDLKECMYQFGPVYYALVCMDPITEHSKGTGFVKFQYEEDAQKCLDAGTELTLMGNILDCHKAINKNDLQNKQQPKQESKDSRNLYLVKEGVILAGSKAAQTVSASDMSKRLTLERWKTQMLRNLNMFVSRYRLVIHNLPESYTDDKLRQLVTKYAGSKAFIKECRVMRDMRSVDKDGKGKSKEFGFVAFQNHEDALKVLRSLNNNPTVFSEIKRPIVAFSIENKAVINAKTQRMEKSKLNNPTYNKDLKNPANKKIITSKDKPMKRSFNKSTENPQDTNDFVGLAGKEGETRMRSKFKLKTQANIHHENLKQRKKQLKNKKKTFEESKKDHIRQPQQKRNTKKKKMAQQDNFSKLVNKYKTKLSVGNTKTKSKWYE